VEWSQHGSLSMRGFGKMLKSVLLNPIILAIAAGLGFDASGLVMPEILHAPIRMLAQSTSPMALVVLGMGWPSSASRRMAGRLGHRRAQAFGAARRGLGAGAADEPAAPGNPIDRDDGVDRGGLQRLLMATASENWAPPPPRRSSCPPCSPR
jgi:hypothetical protein